jgi:hypothetical protein
VSSLIAALPTALWECSDLLAMPMNPRHHSYVTSPPTNRRGRSSAAVASVLAFNFLLNGCAIYTDHVWQPKYPGATVLKRCPNGGPNAIDIQLTKDVLLTVEPTYIDRREKLGLFVLVAPGTTLRLVSNKARIEAAGESVLVPLEYQGPLAEIATSQQNAYELKGRPKYYNFKVVAEDITADDLVVVLPIIIDPDHDLEMVRVQFDNRTTHCVVGMH